MKKLINLSISFSLIIIALIITFSLHGCSNNKDKDVRIDENPIAVERMIHFSQNELSLSVGSTYALSYVVTCDNAEIEWKSSDNDIVTVIDGIVKAEGVGSAKIIASIGEYEKSFCNVHVVYGQNIPKYSISLSSSEISIFKGSKYALKANLIYGADRLNTDILGWSSSNNSVATVDDNGIIDPINCGNTIITAEYCTSDNTLLKATCIIHVCDFYNMIINDVEDKNVGDKFIIIPEIKDSEGKLLTPTESFKYESRCDNIVKYREDIGKFEAVGEGDVDISISYKGFESVIPIHVNGINTNDFVVISGIDGTGVQTVKNVGYVYTGVSGIPEENCVRINKSKWLEYLSNAESMGYTNVVLSVYEVSGAFSPRPFNTNDTLFSAPDCYYVKGDEISFEHPYTVKRSIDYCKGLNGLCLGMYGDGYFCFSILFE